MRFDGTSGQRYGELLHQIERLKMRVCGLEIENESLKKVTTEWKEMHQKDEAVIAGVKDWRSRYPWANEVYYMDKLDAILSGQPEVLAVVDASLYGDTPMARNSPQLNLYTRAFAGSDPSFRKVIAIIQAEPESEER